MTPKEDDSVDSILANIKVEPRGSDLIKMPEPGEYVVLHFWIKTKRKNGKTSSEFFRAIAVGKQPWGPKGERSGVCVDGRIVASTGNTRYKNFDILTMDLLSMAVHINPKDSPVVATAGEIALTMGERERADIVCPKCGNRYPEITGNFFRNTAAAWYVHKSLNNVDKFANSICVKCLQGCREKVEEAISNQSQKASDTRSIAKHIADTLASGGSVYPSNYISPEIYEPVLEAVDLLIEEI